MYVNAMNSVGESLYMHASLFGSDRNRGVLHSVDTLCRTSLAPLGLKQMTHFLFTLKCAINFSEVCC